jgi:hypothetical protein
MREKVIPKLLIVAVQASVVPKVAANRLWHGCLHQESAFLVEAKCVSFAIFPRQRDYASNRDATYDVIRRRLEGEFLPPRRAKLQETGEPLNFDWKWGATIQQPVMALTADFNATRSAHYSLAPPLRVRYPGLCVCAFQDREIPRYRSESSF